LTDCEKIYKCYNTWGLSARCGVSGKSLGGRIEKRRYCDLHGKCFSFLTDCNKTYKGYRAWELRHSYGFSGKFF